MSRLANRILQFDRATLLVLLAGVLLCSASLGRAATVTNSITVKTNYYFVYGSTPATLHQSIEQGRPWRSVAAVDAQTLWSVRYQFTYDQVDGRISPTSFGLSTKINVTLPFWSMPKTVDTDLRERWLEYLRGLYTHEQGHIDFARQATTELAQEFAAVRDFASVQELRQALHTIHTNVLQRVVLQEKLYDGTTRHGATQGAVLRLGRGPKPAGGGTGTAAPAQ